MQGICLGKLWISLDPADCLLPAGYRIHIPRNFFPIQQWFLRWQAGVNAGTLGTRFQRNYMGMEDRQYTVG